MSPRLACPTEHEEQCWLMGVVALHEARHPELELLHAIPNGGHRSKRTAGKMRAEGVKAGIPDLCLPVARRGAHGLYLELKRTRGGVTSPVQTWWHGRLRAEGYRVVVCAGYRAAWAELCSYLSIANTLTSEAA